MNKSVNSYLAKIGRKGGKKSRRDLDPHTARQMVLLREAKKAFRMYHTLCFWSYSPDLVISAADIRWVGEQLLKHGGLRLWILGKKLCP